MKKLLLLSTCFIFSLFVHAQSSSQDVILSQVDDYFAATKDKNWSKVVDMVYPKLFEIVSKDEMVALFEGMESEGMVMNMNSFKVNKVSGIVEHEGEQFARIDYSADMNIRFDGEDYQGETVRDMLLANFKASFGENNVKYIADDNSFDVHGDKIMFAVADAGTSDWYFIEKNEGQEQLMNMLLPEIVVSKLATN